jgi:hypothetical protein
VHWVNGSRQCLTCQRQRMHDRRPRTVGQGGVNAAKTHCPRGHEYTPDNTIWSKDNRRSCRACYQEKRRGFNIQRMGLTVAEFDALWIAQDGKCASCHRPLKPGRGTNVDHNHRCCPGPYSCGKCVRGLLCNGCNIGIGAFEDSSDLLRAAAEYLDR